MTLSRRKLLLDLPIRFAAVGLLTFWYEPAHACLAGRWKVRCPNGHDDIVDQVTCNHNCDECGAQAFKDGEGNVVCPNGHVNHVVTGNRDQQDRWIQSLNCAQCNAECRLPDPPQAHPRGGGRGPGQ
jgi:hypothetical protein